MIFPHITKVQQRVLFVLFSFRYITSSHVQTHLHYKSRRQTNRHLKILKEKGYIREIKSENQREYFNPVVYCLAPTGIRYMQTVKHITDTSIKNRYNDKICSEIFVIHNLLLFTIFLQLINQAQETKNLITFQTKQDFEEESVFTMLHPDVFVLQEKDNGTHQFFFEIIDPITPRFVIRKRIRQYVTYFVNNSVEAETGEEYPKVLFIFPDEKEEYRLLQYAARYMIEQGAEGMVLKATTKKQVLAHGVTSDIWDPAFRM